MRGILSLAVLAMSLCGLIFWGYVVWRIGHTPENHVGWNVLWAIAPFILLTILAAIHAKIMSFSFSTWIVAFALISCLLIVALHKFNIMVPYETWIARGMPERPF
ncbi:MAG: hypothetical protein ABTQ34_07735 [Bdellovibrionales bacterium]